MSSYSTDSFGWTNETPADPFAGYHFDWSTLSIVPDLILAAPAVEPLPAVTVPEPAKVDERPARGAALAAAGNVHQDDFNAWAVKGSTGEWYLVEREEDGRLTCTCRDFRVRSVKNPAHVCKHAHAVLATLPAPVEAPAVEAAPAVEPTPVEVEAAPEVEPTPAAEVPTPAKPAVPCCLACGDPLRSTLFDGRHCANTGCPRYAYNLFGSKTTCCRKPIAYCCC